MASLTPYLPFIWLPLMVLGLASLPGHRRVLVVALIGTLFLPQIGAGEAGQMSGDTTAVKIGPLAFGKDQTISFTLMFIILFYDLNLLLSFSPRWFDIIVFVLCICPFITALINDPPPDGSTAMYSASALLLTAIISFVPPYLAGRLYFTRPSHYRDLAMGFVLSALIYAPLCLWEVRFSPQLHARVYGFGQHSFAQTFRFDGYRPMVFMPHGLALGFWMAVATLVCAWLAWVWKRDPLKKFLVYSLFVLVPTSIFLKSTGAIVLGLFGWVVLCLIKFYPSRLWFLILIAIPILYVTVRSTGVWNGMALVEFTKENISEDRAESFEFRLIMEEMLLDRAFQHPWFGWGAWGRNLVHDDKGNRSTTPDGMWIIQLGTTGFIGLVALGSLLLVPALRFTFMFPPHRWSEEAIAPVTVCCLVMLLWSIEMLPNATQNPFLYMMLSALMGLDPKHFPARDFSPAKTYSRQFGAHIGIDRVNSTT